MSHKRNQNYHIGHNHIDHHHEELFKLTSELDNCIKNKTNMEKVITFIKKDIIEHFDEEESFMKTYNFKYMDEHIQAHNEFRTKVGLISTLYQKEKSAACLLLHVRQFIDQMIGHILTIDKKLTTIEER